MVGLVVNGQAVPSVDPIDIPLVIGTLHVNHTAIVGNTLTRRAVWLETLLGSIVLGEATAGFSGNPCISVYGGGIHNPSTGVQPPAVKTVRGDVSTSPTTVSRVVVDLPTPPTTVSSVVVDPSTPPTTATGAGPSSSGDDFAGPVALDGDNDGGSIVTSVALVAIPLIALLGGGVLWFLLIGARRRRRHEEKTA